ncbi:hypothetical protein GALMADRAFT_250666 [Galerina marginata CBS 339.88]|uniref:Uncharacterized protein n=1 Tax=Galerina marginata (strain CBS 339.88) TaxID=685588 RepID=A0A067SSQ9_GALM3|nr:hypothetical protein GALMADRAFT_250666 [Galerina marginata CBS 339.88]
MQSSSSTSLLNSSSSHMPTPKNWESSFGKLSSSYGFSGSVPSLPKKSSKSPKPSSGNSQSSSSSRSSMSPVPSTSTSTRSSVVPSTKDYESSFGHLSSSYGFGSGVPSLPPRVQKQPKHSSSSQPTVVRPTTGKDYESSFGQLSEMYGFGGPSVPRRQ